MSDWIRTKIGMQAMENIIRYLPRMTVALEEIAEEQKVKKIFYTEVENTKMSYVLTEDIAKVGKKLHEVKEFPQSKEDIALGASVVKSNEEVEGVFMSDGKIKHVDYIKKGK